MTLRAALLALLSSVVTLWPIRNAEAQTDWHVAINAAAILSAQGSGSARLAVNPGFPQPGVSGSAPGLTMGAAIFPSPSFGVGVEISDTGLLDGVQSTAGVIVMMRTVEHHDLIISVPIHYRFQAGQHVQLDAMGGFDYVKERTVVREAYSKGPPGAFGLFGPYGPETPVNEQTVGVVAGFDAAFVVGPHIALGPTLRIHFIDRADAGLGIEGTLGLASAVVRVGGGVRLTF